MIKRQIPTKWKSRFFSHLAISNGKGGAGGKWKAALPNSFASIWPFSSRRGGESKTDSSCERPLNTMRLPSSLTPLDRDPPPLDRDPLRQRPPRQRPLDRDLLDRDPFRQRPPGQRPSGQRLPDRDPPGQGPPLHRDPPPYGTHPTGIHSCLLLCTTL